MMSIDVTLHDDPARALDEAGAFLRSRPVEHNLILTLLSQRISRPEPGRYWLALDGAEVVGVAFMSPIGFIVSLTPMASDAVEALVDAVVEQGEAPLGVSGEAATAAAFAGHWTERRGTAATPHMGMRVYRAFDVVSPDGVPGRLRTATPDDAAEVLAMIEGFHRDTGEASVVDDAAHLARIAGGAYVVWDVAGQTVAMAARTEPVAGMSRVQAVYTPPEHRRRGYAGAVVAELTARVRADGADAMLYTDLGNPTSNAVYRRIGYRAVAENIQYRFA
jgi:predicted GNAT family acetyltransferase